MIDFAAAAPVAGDLDVHWIHGHRPGTADTDPAFQVHAYDEHTYVLRQSKASSYEAPFIYLFFGNERAVLFDSGATKTTAVVEAVDGVVRGWLARNSRDSYHLVVAHTHGHGDHVAGDERFASRPDTTVVGRQVEAVREFFGFSDWPAEVVTFDLGGRVLEVTGIPGHHAASIAVYDAWSGFLVTGDTLYPGRLYAFDFPEFAASLDRLADFAAARQVSHVMGCHLEMSMRPGRDYPLGSRYQPDEPPIQMTVAQLIAARDAARSVAAKPGAHAFDDFIIYNGPCRGAIIRQLIRGNWRRLAGREGAAP